MDIYIYCIVYVTNVTNNMYGRRYRTGVRFSPSAFAIREHAEGCDVRVVLDNFSILNC